ncbi:MAG: ATP-dependent DNA helicase RecG [Eubacteriales bacterium]
MENSRIQYVLKSIHQALKVEEKQGHINVGALGGFSPYLQNILPEIKNIFTIEEYEKLERMVIEYGEMSPIKRKNILPLINSIIFSVDLANFPKEIDERGLGSSENGSKNNNNYNEINETYKNKINQNGKKKVINVEKDGKNQSLQYIKGVGPQRSIQLQQLGLRTVQDLLMYYPRKYEKIISRKINELQDEEIVAITGKVVGNQVSRGRVKVIKLNIEQDENYIHAIWFNQEYIIKQYPIGTTVTITGKVQWKKQIPEILASDIVKGSSLTVGEELIPVYSETARLNSKGIRAIMKSVIAQVEGLFPEYLPPEEAEKWMDRSYAYREIHFPLSDYNMIAARERLVMEEILFIQLAVSRLRVPVEKSVSPILLGGEDLLKRFYESLSFELTKAQKRVISEIFQDMEKQRGMTRLVQGDVGSGKTAVAMAALLKAVGAGYQGAMMAPTEVLAFQHLESLREAFEPLGLNVVLLVGSQLKKEREFILHQIFSGRANIVVGTHALIQEAVRFNSLGLVVTDEQHRFGVRQRTLLQDKGENPHVLVMTATPIPRTLALTLYGDLQLSVLDEMPKGRKPIVTKKITERNRQSLEKFLELQIDQGRQVYVVCPLVEETEKTDWVSATERAEYLQNKFRNRKVTLLHGRLKSNEKDEIMQEFRNGKIDILVATTVIEVGVNVPNATVMVIEGAERFGLAQLHQLRGRVGRGSEQSYCILVSDVKGSARLNILCETDDGFKIAEEDLKLRGPGELLGIRQHGITELRLTDLSKDGKLVEQAYVLLQQALAQPNKYSKLYKEVDKVYPPERIGLN